MKRDGHYQNQRTLGFITRLDINRRVNSEAIKPGSSLQCDPQVGPEDDRRLVGPIYLNPASCCSPRSPTNLLVVYIQICM